jgi:hypothetical protein
MLAPAVKGDVLRAALRMSLMDRPAGQPSPHQAADQVAHEPPGNRPGQIGRD